MTARQPIKGFMLWVTRVRRPVQSEVSKDLGLDASEKWVGVSGMLSGSRRARVAPISPRGRCVRRLRAGLELPMKSLKIRFFAGGLVVMGRTLAAARPQA